MVLSSVLYLLIKKTAQLYVAGLPSLLIKEHAENFSIGGLYNRTTAEMDALLISLAANMATENPEYTIALLTNPRVGVNGEYIPPINYKQESLGAVSAAINAANTELARRASVASYQAVDEENFANIQTGDAVTFSDRQVLSPTGGITWFTAAEQRTAAHRNVIAAIAQSGASPTQARQQRLKWNSDNNFVDPEWREILQGVMGTINNSSLQDPQQLENIMEAVDLYTYINANSRPYLSLMIGLKTSLMPTSLLLRGWVWMRLWH